MNLFSIYFLQQKLLLENIDNFRCAYFQTHPHILSISVSLGNCSSSVVPLTCGVPQRLILGPVLFSLNLLPLGKIFDKQGINCHLYADHSQIYFLIKYGEQSSLESLYNCLADVKCCLANNFLQLNEDKSGVYCFWSE